MANPSRHDLENGWFKTMISDVISEFEDVKTIEESSAKKLEKDTDFLELKKCSADLENLGTSFYSEISGDEHQGFLSVNRIFSEITSIKNRIEESITKLASKEREEGQKAAEWLSGHRIRLLGIIYGIVSDAVNYIKKVAGKLGINSFSITTGFTGFSITFDFNVPDSNQKV